nr:hypothetical protein GCM10020093_095660 [Planobispora longispora]
MAGEWDAAEKVATGFGIRVGTPAEALLSSFALFVEVARGLPAVEERLSWMAPFQSDAFVSYMAHGLAAEHAMWQGDPERALSHIETALEATDSSAAIRLSATGLWALADLGRADAADALLERARTPVAGGPGSSRGWIGPEGMAWAARAEAEWHRAHGRLDVDAWRAVVEAFDFGFVYETARSRWRLAEALLAAATATRHGRNGNGRSRPPRPWAPGRWGGPGGTGPPGEVHLGAVGAADGPGAGGAGVGGRGPVQP